MTIREKAKQIANSLTDKSYSESFVEAEIATTVPFQIRAMRKERNWTQAELAAKTEQHQKTISDFENPDIGPQSISSLRRIAAVFDVGLIVRFAPFSELVDWSTRMSKRSHFVPTRTNDPRLKAQQRGSEAHGAASTQTNLNFGDAGTSDPKVTWMAEWQQQKAQPFIAAKSNNDRNTILRTASAY